MLAAWMETWDRTGSVSNRNSNRSGRHRQTLIIVMWVLDTILHHPESRSANKATTP
jgi:hypothetical protein